MDKDDLKALCEGATTEEVDQLHRLLHQWTVGPENSYPVQMALLTRAQWRAAARLPLAVNQSRELVERKLTEFRHQTTGLFKGFETSVDARLNRLEESLQEYAKTADLTVTAMRSELRNVTNSAATIRKELDRGLTVWNKAREEVEVERRQLAETRAQVLKENKLLDAVSMILILLLILGCGYALGYLHAK